MKLSLRVLLKFSSFLFILLTIGYHLSYFYLDYSFAQFTDYLEETQNHSTYSLLDLDNHYYIEAKSPRYGTLTGQLSITSIAGNYKLIIWRKVPKETTLTFQIYSSSHDKLLSHPLEIKDNSIDLEFTDFSLDTQAQIRDMEKEAKEIWGNLVLENTL